MSTAVSHSFPPLERESSVHAGALALRTTGQAVIACAAVFLAVLIPFITASHVAPPSTAFRGTLAPTGDEGQYLYAVRLGMHGAWLWHDPYMVHAPPTVLMYPVYILAGHLGKLGHISVYTTYALLHACAGATLVAVLWRLASSILPRSGRPWFTACTLAMSGPYWLVALLAVAGHAPIPLASMGSFNLSALTMSIITAHLAFGVAGHLMVLNAVLTTISSSHWRHRLTWSAYGVAGMTLIGMTFPIFLPLSVLIILAWLLVQRVRIRTTLRLLPAAIIVFASLPFIIYYYLLFKHGVWATGAFTQVLPPPPEKYVLIWGLLLPLAYWGWRSAGSSARPAADLLAMWVLLAAVGTQLPFWQGSRFETGLPIAIGGLFGLGLINAVTIPYRTRLLFLISFGAICHYLFLIMALSNGQIHALYGQDYEESAFRWIGTHATMRDVVLAPLGFSNVLPGEYYDVRVVAGHEYQTLDYPLRRVQVATFYDVALPTGTRLAALRATDATLVVDERLDNGPHYAVPPTPLLQPVYRNDHITIYRVARLPASA